MLREKCGPKKVVYLGIIPYGAIPCYLACFNIGLIPFKDNSLTRFVNPVKLYQYSAAGLPTVMTEFGFDNELGYKVWDEESMVETLGWLVDAIPYSPEYIASIKMMAARYDWRRLLVPVLERLEYL